MATTGADDGPTGAPLPVEAMQKLEAAGLRAFPAARTVYDGSWVIRTTPDHPARRLNSINPLDPRDGARAAERLARAAASLAPRPLAVRQTPLCPPALAALMDREGWPAEDRTLVMTAPLEADALADAIDQLPVRDVAGWAAAATTLSGEGDRRDGLVSAIARSAGVTTGLFRLDDGDGVPLATLRLVVDGERVGLFELACAPDRRRKGHARRLLRSGLKWAVRHGAGQGWLHVVATNAPALALYRSLGYQRAYEHLYRRPPL